MKFLELCNGDLFKVGQIKRVYWSCKEKENGDVYFSHIEGVDGKTYDFLEFTTHITYLSKKDGQQKQVDFTHEHANDLHSMALHIMLALSCPVITYKALEEMIWNTLLTKLQDEEAENEKINDE